MNDIEERVTRLESINNERWDAHDKRSNERWGDLKDDLIIIRAKLDQLKCPIHSERMDNFKIALGIMYGVIGAVIAWITNTHYLNKGG